MVMELWTMVYQCISLVASGFGAGTEEGRVCCPSNEDIEDGPLLPERGGPPSSAETGAHLVT
jgi:hypothetical protein